MALNVDSNADYLRRGWSLSALAGLRKRRYELLRHWIISMHKIGSTSSRQCFQLELFTLPVLQFLPQM
ncbi:hypothetical protein AB1N83_012982 [Pleurotus pulmonarius]